jgi:hypothetical protein
MGRSKSKEASLLEIPPDLDLTEPRMVRALGRAIGEQLCEENRRWRREHPRSAKRFDAKLHKALGIKPARKRSRSKRTEAE